MADRYIFFNEQPGLQLVWVAKWQGSRLLTSLCAGSDPAVAIEVKGHLEGRLSGAPIARASQRAAIAVAHTILVIAYHILRNEVAFEDLGPGYFHRLDAGRQKRYYLRRLAALGCDVSQVA